MIKGNSGNRFSTEVRARAVRLVLENEPDYPSRSKAVALISEKTGCSPGTLRDRVRKQAVESGDHAGQSHLDLSCHIEVEKHQNLTTNATKEPKSSCYVRQRRA